jgi:hypothetical protein
MGREEVKLTLQQQHEQEQKQQVEINNNNSSNRKIELGLDFILSHFIVEGQFLFPRKISTHKSNNKQFIVRSKDDIIDAFTNSNFVDCRINVYPYLTDYKGIQRHKPDFIFIDLDKNNNFKSDRSFKLALSNTLKNINEKLDSNAYPTVLDTGGGYHIYQPVYCPTALENITEFQMFEKPSVQFLRFAKDNLSNGKADKNNNPSFKSCLLRVPGSINSKYGVTTEVKIVQKWNGYRPPIPREFMEEFRTYLIQKKIEEQNYSQKMLKLRKYYNNNNYHSSFYYYYDWIEKKILANPFPDYRKIIVNLILSPYLAVIKKLSFEESYQIIYEWLQKCNLIRKLDFNARSLVNTAVATAYKKQIPPMSITTLKNNYKDLYFLLEQKGKHTK